MGKAGADGGSGGAPGPKKKKGKLSLIDLQKQQKKRSNNSDNDDSDERKEKKIKLVVRLPQSSDNLIRSPSANSFDSHATTGSAQLPFAVNFSGRLDLSRLIYWHRVTFKFLPSGFYVENIVAIDLSSSNIKQPLPTAIVKCLPRLKMMKLIGANGCLTSLNEMHNRVVGLGINLYNVQRVRQLGCGSFGRVYVGMCNDGFLIAVKEVLLSDYKKRVQLMQEIGLLSQFEHENIVRYYGIDMDKSTLYVFLELVTEGSLLSLYVNSRLQDCQVPSYTRQILHGLKYLHDRNVVHSDLKCANILVDANGSVKLTDFGLAKVAGFEDVTPCDGTVNWLAPEVVNQTNKGYGLAADIWSLGCTVLEMLTCQIPYYKDIDVLFKIGNGVAPPVPDSLSKEAKDFISQCFRVKPIDRPTATQLLDHPFVRRPLPVFSDDGPSSSRLRRQLPRFDGPSSSKLRFFSKP